MLCRLQIFVILVASRNEQGLISIRYSGSQVLPSYRAAFEMVSACVKGRCLLMSDVKLGCTDEGCWGTWQRWQVLLAEDGLLGVRQAPMFTAAEML